MHLVHIINYRIIFYLITIYASYATRRGEGILDVVMPWSPMTLTFYSCSKKRKNNQASLHSLLLLASLIYIFFDPTLFLFLSYSRIGKDLPSNSCAQKFILGFMSSSSSAVFVCLLLIRLSFHQNGLS